MAYQYGGFQGYPSFSPQQTFFPQQQQQPAAVGQGISRDSRPVTSREEAVSIPADFSGSLMIFPDIQNNRVYIKRWNFNTGTAEVMEYVPAAAQTEPKYITVEEFNAFKEAIAKRLKKPVKEEVPNDAE